MARKKNIRNMIKPPPMAGFRPFATAFCPGENVELLFEEYEALRLADYENQSHKSAAILMNVSRPTFTRILEQAHSKIAKAFMESRSIHIEGGNVNFKDFWYKCKDCNKTFSTKSQTHFNCPACKSSSTHYLNSCVDGQKFSSRAGIAEAAYCICPGCKKTYPHKQGLPCRENKCPDCNTYLVRVK